MFSNFLYFLIALVIYTTSGLFEDTTRFEGGVILSSLLLNIVFVLICQTTFKRLTKMIGRIPFDRVDNLVNKYISRLSILALMVFALNIYGLRLHLYLRGIVIFDLFPTLGALMFLSLFLFYLVVIWDASYKIQKSAFSGQISKKQYIVSNISFSLPALFPWFCLSIIADMMALVPYQPLQTFLKTPIGEMGYIALFIVAIAIFGPVLIKRLWHCKPLEEGEQKKRLEAICRNAGLRYSDILKWELFGGYMITAGVMGLVARFRYILVTPALLNSLSDEEIEAVILHEIGHVQKHHMLFYLFFFAGFIACNFVFFEPIGLLLYILPVYGLFQFVGIDQATAHSILSSLTLIILFVLYFRLVFGLYMRSFERQADLHIYEFKNNALAMISTFYKIASYSRQSMEKPNWHHYSIGQRVRFLENCQAKPDLIARHHTRVKKLVSIYAIVVVFLFSCGYAINYGWAKESFGNFITKKILFQQMDLHPENSDLYALVGDYYYSRQDYQKAIDSYENVLRVDPENVHALNNLSWLFSTCPDEMFRDNQQALLLARKALARKRESYILDTYAEALLVNKDIPNAIAAANEALKLAKDKKNYYKSQIKRLENM
ncbi:MAG: M48 family metalloprotease [Desulfobacula sp.]|nr:M48 family metalloprotease [Desulfobacula sp.]